MCYSYNHTSITKIYTLSLHDALPIFHRFALVFQIVDLRLGDLDHDAARRIFLEQIEPRFPQLFEATHEQLILLEDRKSTRLNSSHLGISYAVFCLKQKKK